MSKSELRSFYRPHPRVTARNEIFDPKTGEVLNPPSMTKQSFVKECDINNILKQYSTTGQINHIAANAAKGVYAELPELADYQEALNIGLAADAAFASLPSHVRRRFEDDPAAFLAFMENPDNKAEMEALGLLNKSPGTPLPEGVPDRVQEPEKPAGT